MTAVVPKLRGDICPQWCGGEHGEQRFREDGRPLHPEDQGVMHYSASVDAWFPRYGHEGLADEPIEVRVEGKRHDIEAVEVDGKVEVQDWPDMVYATNVEPGFVCAVGLHWADARRLGLALIAAAELAEGR